MIDKTSIDEKKLAKLYREVRIMKMLRHPNIVTLYEVIETKYSLFLVMEYASGGELYDYLVVHGRSKEKDARVKFRQILEAVWYCHQQRIIHRDLKAENLLLDANFNIKIADFGFSNLYNPASQLETFCGSPPYAAPELFQGKAYVGPEVDVWSLGVILYVLTTGYLPFDGKTLAEMRESVCKAKYRIPFYLSEGVEKLLKKMLVRDPSKRAGLQVIADDAWLNEGCEGSPFDATPALPEIKEDDSLVTLMEAKFKIPKDTILKALRENSYDDVAAIYYLMYAQKSKEPNTKLEESSSLFQPVAISPPSITKLNTPSPPRMTPISEDDDDAPILKPGEKASIKVETSGSMSIKANQNPASPESPTESPESSKTPELRQISIGAGHRRRFTVGANDESGMKPSPLRQVTMNAPASAPPVAPKQGRSRGSTLTSIFKQKKAATESASPVDDEKPRSLRFTFNSKTTSSLPPAEIMSKVMKTCNELQFKFKSVNKFLLEILSTIGGAAKFEIEVCRLPRLNNIHGLRFKRIEGSSASYKSACEKILEKISLEK